MRRLRDVLDVRAVAVVVDEGDGGGAAELARAGPAGGTVVLDVALPVTPPLRGSIRLLGPPSDRDGGEDLVELVAYRVAMAVESRWLRAVDQRRRAWMAYLAEASELLGQSLSVELAVAVVPQVVVPRLGRWCAVYLVRRGHAAAGRAHPRRRGRAARAARGVGPRRPAGARPGAARPARPALRRRRRRCASPRRPTGSPCHCGPAAPRSAPCWWGGPTGGRTRPRTSSSSPTSPGAPPSPCRTPRAPPPTSRCRRRCSRRCCPARCPRRPGSTSRRSTCPRAAARTSAATSTTSSPSTAGQLLVSIGDVCGKGARAAARTGLVRDVLRVLVRGGRGLAEAVHLLNEVMMEAADAARSSARSPPRSCGATARVPAASRSSCSSRATSGRCWSGRTGGSSRSGSSARRSGCCRRCWSRPPPTGSSPGDTLLLYTDGVTERRRGREQFGPERLLALAARTAGRPARQVVAAVRDAVERFSPDPATDDVALLAVRALPE